MKTRKGQPARCSTRAFRLAKDLLQVDRIRARTPATIAAPVHIVVIARTLLALIQRRILPAGDEDVVELRSREMLSADGLRYWLTAQ